MYFKTKILPSVSIVSAVAGAWAGIIIERKRSSLADQHAHYHSGMGKSDFGAVSSTLDRGFLSYVQHYFMQLSTVSAKSLPSPGNLPVANQPDPELLPGNRTSQIMKFGFPSMDNIRAYEDFVLSYDRRNRTANWVFEHLTREKVKSNDNVTREASTFYEDTSMHEFFRATNDDYKKSGFDRGHLAAAGNHKWSQKAMDQTFVLNNISPQIGRGFNRDGWNTLEKYVRYLTKSYRNVYVCTGPLYLPRHENGKLYVKYQVIGKNHVSVPTHFFKVILCEGDKGEFELLSFVMPNEVLPEKIDLKHYLVPVETIERSAGLLLFDRLPKDRLTKLNGKRL